MQFFRVLCAICAVCLLGIVGLVALLWLIDSPYPSDSTVSAWEKNYRSKVSQSVSDFQGHWLSTDIAAYIYSYHYTSDSVNEHQKELIHTLKDFKIHEQTSTKLVLRQSVTYSQPDGYNEWQFLFDSKSNLVTVLYANLDSELSSAVRLNTLTEEHFQKRKKTEQDAAANP